MSQTFESKSALSHCLGAKMKLVRWNRNHSVKTSNLILLTNSEFQKHILIKNSLNEIYDSKTISEIEEKLNSIK